MGNEDFSLGAVIPKAADVDYGVRVMSCEIRVTGIMGLGLWTAKSYGLWS